MRIFAIVVVALMAVVAVPANAAGKRVALVVGNNAYHGGLQPLSNAVNDAELIERVLTDAGFDVDRVPDAGGAALSEAIRRFTKRLREAGPDAVGLFYFAGHGLQYKGTNYLLATDATLGSSADIPRRGFDAANVLWALHDGGAATSIVIIDACRQNHVSSALRSTADDGLTELDKKGLDKRQNVLIAYSTGLGEPATDGDKYDGNSPFARILAQNIPVPNLEIVDMFRRVSRQMVDGFDQKPWLDVGWGGGEEFAFVGKP